MGGGTLGAYTIERVIADATVRILGIMGGCQYVDAAGNTVFSQFWPASTALLTGTFATVWVYDDPFLELIAQMSTFALTDTNADYDVNMAAGSAVTGRSAAFIDQADVTGSKFRVLGLAPIGEAGRVGPSDIGAFAKVRCRIISHERNALMTTAF